MTSEQATPGQAAESPSKPRPDDKLTCSVADMLRRIEANYDREGSGPGSRFEGRLLEDVQAGRVIEAVAAPLREQVRHFEGLVTIAREERDAVYAQCKADVEAARAEAASLREQLDRAESDVSDYRDALTAMQRERDAALADVASAEEYQAARWPRCPDGCGCRMDGQHADVRDCGCDGPCTMECAENGYPDAPSYRDQARAQLAEVRRIAYQGGQDAASVRRELLAWLEACGGHEGGGDGGAP